MRNVKRALSLVLVLALALTMCVVGAGAAKYSDVPSTYAYSSEVQFLSDIEVITGYPDGTFKPENTITRGEAAAVIFRTLAGKESAAQNYQGSTQFSDVSAEHWACGYVNFCTEMGIINGYPDGTFKPDQTVTYAEYVTMLARALGLDIGKDLSYPYGYIAEATVEGVNLGVDLGANDPAPRGSVAKLTYNAIFDATYKRIANNIYTTKKPTIAENVLQLITFEGIVTSTGEYSWDSGTGAGNGKFRVMYTTDTNYTIGSTNIVTNAGQLSTNYEYDIDKAMLGKEVKVWYKPNAVTASGDKIYAVIEKANTSATLPHIVIKGLVTGDAAKHQITYALNDVDYKAKLDDSLLLVENNDYWDTLDFVTNTDDPTIGAGTAQAVLASFCCYRDWLPVSWTFIDTDNNGKYDIIHRMVYGFAKVTGINSDTISLENVGSIDRKTDNGKSYAWNDGLEDVGEDDWVIYYADGKVTDPTQSQLANHKLLVEGPSFDGIYEDTEYAMFQKMDFATLEVEQIADHDKYVFDGATYRTWGSTYVSLAPYYGVPKLTVGDYKDLVEGSTINASVGDEFDLWYTKQFGGIIAAAESSDGSTGNFIVMTGIESSPPDRTYGNFTIYGYDEKGNDVDFTVRANKNKGLNEYLDGTGETQTAKGTALSYDNVNTAFNAAIAVQKLTKTKNEPCYALVEYKMNSAGQITEMNIYGTDGVTATPAPASTVITSLRTVTPGTDYKSYYNTKTGILKTSGGSLTIEDNALIFSIKTSPDNIAGTTIQKTDALGNFLWVDNVKVITGSFPKLNNATAPASIDSFKVKDGKDVKAMVVNIKSGTFSSSENEDLMGYLRAVADKGDHYEYTIAYADDAATVLSSRSGSDLQTIVNDDNLIDTAEWISNGKQAGMIKFDIAADGTITEMEFMYPNYTSGDNEYLGTFIVNDFNSSKKTVELVPINGGTTAYGMSSQSTGVWSGTEYTVIKGQYDANVGLADTYSLGADANVFVINPTTTNKAGTTLGSMGDLVKVTTDATGFTRGMVVTVVYNNDDNEIVSIFANKQIVKQ